MTAKIIEIGGITYLDIPADKILESAKGKLDGLLVIGTKEDGEEYFASSFSDAGTILWLLERAKLQLLRSGDEE